MIAGTLSQSLRKSDRIDANKLARLGWVDPQSLYPIRHRSREVRRDLVVLRARDALVSVRTELINTTRGLVKSMGTPTAAVFESEFCRKGKGCDSGRGTGSAAALGATGRDGE